MRGCKGQTGPACRAAHDAAGLIDAVEPVVKIKLRRRTVCTRRIARIFPVIGAAGLLAFGFTVEPRLRACISAGTQLLDSPVQRIRMSSSKL
jgi:hypothetical protein